MVALRVTQNWNKSRNSLQECEFMRADVAMDDLPVAHATSERPALSLAAAQSELIMLLKLNRLETSSGQELPAERSLPGHPVALILGSGGRGHARARPRAGIRRAAVSSGSQLHALRAHLHLRP